MCIMCVQACHGAAQDDFVFAGGWSFYVAWIYGSLCMATFIVRTMKRVLFRDARQYSKPSFISAVLLCMVINYHASKVFAREQTTQLASCSEC